MRIDELNAGGRQDIRGKTRKEIQKVLIDAGYRELGRGSFGMAFAIPGKTDKVLKIFHEDEAYLWWVEYCRKNSGNPWLPKFRSKPVRVSTALPVLRTIEQTVYAVIIETLTPNRDNSISYVIQMMIDGAVDDDMVDEHLQPLLTDENLNRVATDLRPYSDDVDMRRENIMMRGDQYVITDPLAF